MAFLSPQNDIERSHKMCDARISTAVVVLARLDLGVSSLPYDRRHPHLAIYPSNSSRTMISVAPNKIERNKLDVDHLGL